MVSKFSDFFNSNLGSFDAESFAILIEGLPTSGTFDIDSIFLVPVTDGFLIGKASVSQDFFADGLIGQAFSNFNADSSFVGNVFDMIPGNETTRIRWLSADYPTNYFTIANTNQITLTVTPRTSHLLGTA